MKNQRGGIGFTILIGIMIIWAFVLLILIIMSNSREHDRDIMIDYSLINNTNNTNTSDTNIANENRTNLGELVNTEFTLGFLKKENNKQNMLYSPLSIKYALKMLQEGAKEETYSQIEKVIGNLNLPKYNNIENKLSLANSIFIRDTYFPYVKTSYTDILTNKYNAEVIQDKFNTAKNVNTWIENKTLGKIKKMLSDELVYNPDLEMLLINALAIDMEWKAKFDAEDTYGENFYLSDGKTMKATTMSKETSSDNILYYLEKDLTAVSMDLEDFDEAKMEFVAVMPKKNIDQYVNNLTIDKINEITNNLNKASSSEDGIILKIPKFSFEYDLKLKEDLQSLGITDVFNRELANLSNMADLEKTGKNLYVSDALHKANIDFSEKGVKAAAVTVFAVMDATAMMEPKQPIEVKIDKPFVFLIRDKETKEIWFVGTVYEPNSWEKDKTEYEQKDSMLIH